MTYEIEFNDVDGENWKKLENKWLKFSSASMIFSGTPSKENLDHIYSVKLIASDGYKTAEQIFYINLTDEAP